MLLVIFMVAVPVTMRNIAVVVPRDLKAPEIPMTRPVLVKGMVDGTLEISDGVNSAQIVQRTQLAMILRARLEEEPSSKIVFVDFDDGIQWEEVVSVMDTIKGLGKTGPTGRREAITVALRKRKTGTIGPSGEMQID